MNELPNILYVDDEIINLKLFDLSFRSHFTIFTASSASQGLEILEKYPVNVIATDYKMPGMNGIEFVEKIKNKNPEKICIMITGYTHEIGHTNKDSLFCTITKPWDKHDLLKTLQAAFLHYDQQKLGL
jgi:two-component system, sensor histidine kinase and response regulator